MSTFPQYSIRDVMQPVDEILWTPDAWKSRMVSWHDASDAATLDKVGGFVYRRLDKSGNERHLEQSTTAARPAVGDNKDVYASGDSMELPWYSVEYTTSPIYCVLLAKSSYYSTTTPIVRFGSSPVGFGWEIRASYGATLRCGSSNKYSWQTVSTYNAIFQAQFGSLNRYRVQSSYSSGDWTSVGLSLPVAPMTTPIVGGLSAGQGLDFYEMIVLNTEVTDEDIYLVTAYLAHKWDALLGIGTYVSRLDATNPYKSTLPKIRSTAASPRMYDGVPGSI